MGQVTTVVLGGVTYSIYGERDNDAGTAQLSSNEYLQADVKWASVWSPLTNDQKSMALISATREIDAVTWKGTKTSPAQPLDWPRTGVTYADGTAVDSATVPDEVVFATYIIAAMLAEDPEALDQTPAQAANIQYVKAGSAEVRFQRVLSTGIFPSKIQALLGQFLAGAAASGLGGAYVTGATDYSVADACDAYTVGRP